MNRALLFLHILVSDYHLCRVLGVRRGKALCIAWQDAWGRL